MAKSAGDQATEMVCARLHNASGGASGGPEIATMYEAVFKKVLECEANFGKWFDEFKGKR